MKKILSILLILLSYTVTTYADHIGQVEIRYEFNGTNYTVFVTQYKECINNPSNTVSLADSVSVRIESKSLNTIAFKMLYLRSKDTINLGLSLIHI